jgi:hypothetical protein
VCGRLPSSIGKKLLFPYGLLTVSENFTIGCRERWFLDFQSRIVLLHRTLATSSWSCPRIQNKLTHCPTVVEGFIQRTLEAKQRCILPSAPTPDLSSNTTKYIHHEIHILALDWSDPTFSLQETNLPEACIAQPLLPERGSQAQRLSSTSTCTTL